MPKTLNAELKAVQTSNALVTNYPSKLCRKQQSKYDDSHFRSISFRFKNAWASFVLSEDNVSPAKRRDGRTIPNRLNLDLGDSEDIRFVSVKKDDDTYERKPFFNRTIKSIIDGEKKDYLRSIAL